MAHESTVPEATPLVEVVLQGGPPDIPAGQRWFAVASDLTTVKVERLGGYEHFEREHVADHGHGGPVVFRWTMRTRIAE